MESLDWVTACRLESERLVLEPLRPEQREELAPVLGDNSLHHFIGGQPPGVEDLRARFQRQVVGRSPDGGERWLNWAVRDRASGNAVGTLQATVKGGRRAVAELAWVIGVCHQRQGLAKEAAGLMTAWLREQGIGCLRAHIHPRHHASMAVARSIGLRPTDVMVDGERDGSRRE